MNSKEKYYIYIYENRAVVSILITRALSEEYKRGWTPDFPCVMGIHFSKLQKIVKLVSSVLDETPPELMEDVLKR
jgi:actin-like ATPase involved in cell morphogenesis